MIKSLHICNYALIDELDIDFRPGFNIITGETGAGKSIILGALSLLLGDRADTRVVRDKDRKSVSEAVFELVNQPVVENILQRNDLLDGPDNTELILRREIAPGGRSRAFVNDTPVTLAVLREIAVQLVDIHSQHQNQLLALPDYQLGIIDSLAANTELLADYRVAFNAYRKALKVYTDTRDMIRRNQDDADFIQFQYNQLEEMDLQPGENQSLEQEREILANVGELKESLAQALVPLSQGEANVLSLLRQAIEAVETLSVSLSDHQPEVDFHSLAERLDSARIEIADVSDTLLSFDDSLAADPERLQEVEQRLSSIYSLEAKHSMESTDQLLELQHRLKHQLDALDNSEETLANLETMARRAKKKAVELATKLSESRAAAAAEFAERLREVAAPLGMANLRCDISMTRGKLGYDGFDQLTFLFAFNKNQSLMPVGATASGGEMSRLMLAVRSIVAERMKLPTIIFDEVDTGVSGEIAARMALMMVEISRSIQVLTITHLPGVAAMGSTHFKVYKEDSENATTTRIKTLSQDEREHELALMIGGNAHDKAAIANAKALLKGSKTDKL